jgi:hypothetical protein
VAYLPNIKGEADDDADAANGNPNAVSITVKSGDGTTQRTLSLSAPGSMFSLAPDANVALSIGNVKLLGLAKDTTIADALSKEWTPPGGELTHIIIPDNPSNDIADVNNTASLVYVGAGNSFEMNAGSTITGNATPGPGGGVQVAGGVLTMNTGAEISGNAASLLDETDGGGGVHVGNGGQFIMSGGAISGNGVLKPDSFGEWGGGVTFAGDGTSFEMEGGTITGNYCGNGGGGVMVTGGGLFTMSGATSLISGNHAGYDGGGMYCFQANFTMEAGEISGNASYLTLSGTPFPQFGANGGTQIWPAGTHFKITGLAGSDLEGDGQTAIANFGSDQTVNTVIKAERLP